MIWKESRFSQSYRWIISEFPSPCAVSIHLPLRVIAAEETEMLCQNERVSVLFKAAFRTPATTQKPLGCNVFLQQWTALISSPPHHVTLRHLLMSDGRNQKLFAWDCCFFSVFLALLFIQSLRPTGLSGVQDLSCCYKWVLFHFYWVLCLDKTLLNPPSASVKKKVFFLKDILLHGEISCAELQ